MFLFLMCFKIFLPHEYLVCGSFRLRCIHLHFSMMIRILSLAFPIFLIPLGCPFAYAGVCHISPFPIICEFHLQALAHSLRSLIKTGLRETGGEASFPTHPGDHPPEPACVLQAVYFYPAHFSIRMTARAAKMICLHLCHVSGPFISCQTSEFMDGTCVPVGFCAGVTHKKKVSAFTSRAAREYYCQFHMCVETQSSFPRPVGMTRPPIPSNESDASLHSSLCCCTGQETCPRESQQGPEPLSASKIIWTSVCNIFLCHWEPEFSLGANLSSADQGRTLPTGRA